MAHLLSPTQLDNLRAQYATINGIDPSSPTYKQLIDKLDSYPTSILQQLAGARIKFVSGLAANRARRQNTRESVSPSSVHNDILRTIAAEIIKLPHLANATLYKQAAREILISKPVIPSSQVEQMVNRFITAYPYTKYHNAKRVASQQPVQQESVTQYGHGSGRSRKDILKDLSTAKTSKERSLLSTEARKAGATQAEIKTAINTQFESTRLLSTQTAGKKTAKIYRDSEYNEYIVKFYIDGQYQKDADYFTDDKQDAIDTANSQIKRTNEALDDSTDMLDTTDNKNPRDIEREVPSEFDLDWVSKFDLSEIKEAIQKIIDHLAETDDAEQTEVLRNDIRVLDNLHSALSKKDSDSVDKYWKIAKSEGTHEHLHPEFVTRLDDATALVSVKEGYSLNESNIIFKDRAKWSKAAKQYNVKNDGDKASAFCRETGAMMGRWSGKQGWIDSK